MTTQETNFAEETLDPTDWAATRALAHRMVDDAINHLDAVRERPLWLEMPASVKAGFTEPLPQGPQPLEDVYSDITASLMPHPMGNIHPRFWMWYMGAGNFTGALGDFLAAIDGSNLGGGNMAASQIDRQVTDWIRDMMGFPETASGTLVTGGSMANIIGLMAARNAMAGVDLRQYGVDAMAQPLRFYASDQVHSCHFKAMNLLGLGKGSLCKVPSDGRFRMSIDALKEQIRSDLDQGIKPACVIATAGTTNTGSIDDLSAIADLCAAEGLWMHVDGCIGALISIAPDNRHLVAGIERADSLALDLHKGLQAPFDVGCALVRDRRQHRLTFAEDAEYLQKMSRGISAAEFLHDYNLDTSRGFRALKIWMMLKEHGVEKFGRLIDQGIAQAHYLTERITHEPMLELMAPTVTDVVCFRYNPGGLDEGGLRDLNIEVMLRLQEAGTAAVSDTTIHGSHCLRAAICNHRTRRTDLDLLVQETLRIGGDLVVPLKAQAGHG
ncbi:pyridoxal phosphate-dependent decarboxylase family protein [Cypionkella psychrotolerans]|uniref:pyridoxal phosphate-dependent decarboxylase family protein n=1 Tax=Cypionkella psychrotolerans TaxID=1678131 RepID=UPI0006B452ED|nr:pyridoxal-dependent decarboxylase [Cypionkella psychrotolerans]